MSDIPWPNPLKRPRAAACLVLLLFGAIVIWRCGAAWVALVIELTPDNVGALWVADGIGILVWRVSAR